MARSTDQEGQIAALLAHRYGDGSLYLPDSTCKDLLPLAIERGLVSTEGFVTRKGRAYLASLGH